MHITIELYNFTVSLYVAETKIFQEVKATGNVKRITYGIDYGK